EVARLRSVGRETAQTPDAANVFGAASRGRLRMERRRCSRRERVNSDPRDTRTEGRNLQNSGVRLLTREAINGFGLPFRCPAGLLLDLLERHDPGVLVVHQLGALLLPAEGNLERIPIDFVDPRPRLLAVLLAPRQGDLLGTRGHIELDLVTLRVADERL